MCEVLMKTIEPVSTREGTETTVKIPDSTYAGVDIEQVAAK